MEQRPALVIPFSLQTSPYSPDATGLGATAGAGLTSGRGPLVDLNAEGFVLSGVPLPYTGFAGGALNGCASVLNTSANVRSERAACLAGDGVKTHSH